MSGCVKKPHTIEKSSRREMNRETWWRVRKFNPMEGSLLSTPKITPITRKKKSMKF